MSAPDLPPNTALKSPKRILSDQKVQCANFIYCFYSTASIVQHALSFAEAYDFDSQPHSYTALPRKGAYVKAPKAMR